MIPCRGAKAKRSTKSQKRLISRADTGSPASSVERPRWICLSKLLVILIAWSLYGPCAQAQVKRPDAGKGNRQGQRAMHQAAQSHRRACGNHGHDRKNQKRSAHLPHSAKR